MEDQQHAAPERLRTETAVVAVGDDGSDTVMKGSVTSR